MAELAYDFISTYQIDVPFWDLMKDPRWKNVDADMKEAIDRRDSAGRDAALYALKALERVVKIISSEKGWNRGAERGTANYIGNLVSSSNGRFIEVWEAETLRALFRDLRYPHGHGPVAQSQPSLTIEQQTWIIETSMSWIKSLVLRL